MGWSICVLVWGLGILGGSVPVLAEPNDTRAPLSQSSSVEAKVLSDGTSYSYHPGSRRDPFMPPGITKTEDSRRVLPVTKVPFEVRLVGIAHGKNGFQALLDFGTGRRTIVSAGVEFEYGQGVVKAVTEHSIIFEISDMGQEESRHRIQKEIMLEFQAQQE